jgi:amino acid transporter
MHTEEPIPSVAAKARTLGAFAVAILSFAAVAGGPYGIEAAVGAAGPLPVLVGSIILAIAWSATQSLVAAELASVYPCNGGAITWVVKGLGPHLGFVNAMNVIASAICNLPLYPVLFASYVQQLVPSLPGAALWAIKLAVLLVTVTLNCLGLQVVEHAATAFSIFVQTPFIVIPVAAAVYGVPFNWKAVGTAIPTWSSSLGLFVSTLCWNSQVGAVVLAANRFANPFARPLQTAFIL